MTFIQCLAQELLDARMNFWENWIVTRNQKGDITHLEFDDGEGGFYYLIEIDVYSDRLTVMMGGYETDYIPTSNEMVSEMADTIMSLIDH
jgi:hypothetical protein